MVKSSGMMALLPTVLFLANFFLCTAIPMLKGSDFAADLTTIEAMPRLAGTKGSMRTRTAARKTTKAITTVLNAMVTSLRQEHLIPAASRGSSETDEEGAAIPNPPGTPEATHPKSGSDLWGTGRFGERGENTDGSFLMHTATEPVFTTEATFSTAAATSIRVNSIPDPVVTATTPAPAQQPVPVSQPTPKGTTLDPERGRDSASATTSGTTPDPESGRDTGSAGTSGTTSDPESGRDTGSAGTSGDGDGKNTDGSASGEEDVTDEGNTSEGGSEASEDQPNEASEEPSDGSVCVSEEWLIQRGYSRSDFVHNEPVLQDVLCPSDAFSALPCGTQHHAVALRGELMSYRELCTRVRCTHSTAHVNSLWAFHGDSVRGIDVGLGSNAQLFMHDTRYPRIVQAYLHFVLHAVRYADTNVHVLSVYDTLSALRSMARNAPVCLQS